MLPWDRDKLRERSWQPLVVEKNEPAPTNRGWQRSPSHARLLPMGGYTFCLPRRRHLSLTLYVKKKLSYDPSRIFHPAVAMVPEGITSFSPIPKSGPKRADNCPLE